MDHQASLEYRNCWHYIGHPVVSEFQVWLTIQGVMLSSRSIWREARARLGQARALCTPDPSGLKSLWMTPG